MSAPCIAGTSSGAFNRAGTKRAWTAFWQEPGQARCIAAAVDTAAILDEHWSSFAATLPANTRILDLGCGAGAVGRALLTQRRDIYVTGVDFAKIPLTLQPHLELLSDAPMESLPFADRSFGAATSQFGFEYSQVDNAAAEMTRVLAPGAPFSFLAHHAGSTVVAADRTRLNALLMFLHEDMRAAFCTGDLAFNARIVALREAYPDDSLVAELAHALLPRALRPPRERLAIWSAVEDALAPELCLAEALIACCVAPEDLAEWARPLRAACDLKPVSILPDSNGAPLAWRIEGVRR